LWQTIERKYCVVRNFLEFVKTVSVKAYNLYTKVQRKRLSFLYGAKDTVIALNWWIYYTSLAYNNGIAKCDRAIKGETAKDG
jgi:hypothetical protein